MTGTKPEMETPVVVVGAGPAGLMAAEALARAGRRVVVRDASPSPSRKFLLAGRGGLNLTHSEPLQTLLTRYGAAAKRLRPAIEAFPPEALRRWAAELGEETFVGSSGRVFPKSFKATPLLRAWLRRLEGLGVERKARSRFAGFGDGGRLRFDRRPARTLSRRRPPCSRWAARPGRGSAPTAAGSKPSEAPASKLRH